MHENIFRVSSIKEMSLALLTRPYTWWGSLPR